MPGAKAASYCAFAAGLAMAASAPAGARSDLSTKKARAAMHAYAKCVVKRQARKASEALTSNADNGTILREYRSLIDGECLEVEVAKMSFGGDLFRYALADALVDRELADQPVPELARVPRLAHRTPSEPPEPAPANAGKAARKKFEKARRAYEEALGIGFLSSYGECIVRFSPAGAKALLATTPDSPQETAGFDALRPAFAACLVEGRTLRFGRVALRGSIAINYFRLAHAARASAPSAEALVPTGYPRLASAIESSAADPATLRIDRGPLRGVMKESVFKTLPPGRRAGAGISHGTGEKAS